MGTRVEVGCCRNTWISLICLSRASLRMSRKLHGRLFIILVMGDKCNTDDMNGVVEVYGAFCICNPVLGFSLITRLNRICYDMKGVVRAGDLQWNMGSKRSVCVVW